MAGPVKTSMQLGYNHNVNYKGVTFHIQTEDSGIANPHIITLLYVGGNIISRKKISYADIIKHERLRDVVRELMQDQHKQMLKDLKNGDFDGHPLAQAEFTKRGISVARPAAKPKEVPAPVMEAAIQEKPAEKTIELKEGQELRDEDLFGADIISNKSLDEVILGFLSERLDEEEK